MQRRILAALAASPGGDRVEYSNTSTFALAPGIHDLRKVSKALAREHGGISHCDFVYSKWQASFSRAVAGLVARGYLEAPSLVPISDVGQVYDAPLRRQVHHLADGSYIDQSRHQQRYVSVMQNNITVKS
jgi:hypothetical protein